MGAAVSADNMSLKGFVTDCCVQQSDSRIPKQQLLEAYRQYCTGHKLPIVTSDAFFKRLPEIVKVESARSQVDGKRPMCYIGIMLREKTDGAGDTQHGSTAVRMIEAVDALDSPTRFDGENVSPASASTRQLWQRIRPTLSRL